MSGNNCEVPKQVLSSCSVALTQDMQLPTQLKQGNAGCHTASFWIEQFDTLRAVCIGGSQAWHVLSS